MKKKVFYYKDELNDEFSGINRKTILVDKNFKYLHKNWLYKFLTFVVYRINVMPFAFLYLTIKFHIKIENKKVLKTEKKESYFMYGNHTQIPGDGFIPNVLNFPKHNAVVVNADNVSLFGTKNIMLMLGAVPIPNDFSGMKNFLDCISYNVKQNKGIVIYPEAHVWPYYTGIRDFKSDSFKFPIMYNTKTFCFTVTYQKRKFSKNPNITLFVDGPFSAPRDLSKKERQEYLKSVVYDSMVERSKKSTYSFYKYVKIQNEGNSEIVQTKVVNEINLLYCGNFKVFDGLLISLLSMTKYTKEIIKVFVITMDLQSINLDYAPISQSQINYLENMIKEVNSESSIKLFDISKIFLEETKNSPNLKNNYTPYTLARLYADKIPEIPNKILYLDTDTIMHGDISSVFETDIENYEFAAAIDFLGKFFIRYNYQNAGVMLLNMKKIRETKLFQRARNLIKTKKMAFPDQDALNKLVEKKKFISTKYNEQRMLHKKTVIHHFCKSIRWFPFFHTVNIKPWNVDDVRNVYKLHCYDDVLDEYKKRISKLKKKEVKNV